MFDPWVEKIPPEKETATHSSILACRILWAEELGGLQSMGLKRVGHDLVTKQQQQGILQLLGATWVFQHRCSLS